MRAERSILPVGLPAALLAALLAPGCADETPVARTPCNVLLISIDSLRADHLHAYGYERETSPRLDGLAAEGALFETVVAESSWTLPTHLSMLTGLPTGVHQVYDDTSRLSDEHVTLAEALHAAGWRTHGLWSGPYLHPLFGFGQGFDTYEGLIGKSRLDREGFDLADATPGRQVALERAHGRSHQSVTSPELADRAIELLEEGGEAPFFLFVHFFDVHYDYIPPEPYWRRFDPDYEGSLSPEDFLSNPAIAPDMDERDLGSVIARYDGEILFTDEHVGRVLDALERLGLADDTLVMVTADHGEEFFEHGGKGHRRTLFDEVLLVPLIARHPGRIPAGGRVAAQVRQVDVTPTILDWVGLPVPAGMLGRSLAPALRGEARGEELPAVATLHDPRSRSAWTALRHDGWKWIERPGAKRRWKLLYDLTADPGERTPLREDPRLSQAEAELARIRELEEHLVRALDGKGAATVELPEEIETELRALGYVE